MAYRICFLYIILHSKKYVKKNLSLTLLNPYAHNELHNKLHFGPVL